MLLNSLQCTGQVPTTKNYPVQNDSSAEVEESCSNTPRMFHFTTFALTAPSAMNALSPGNQSHGVLPSCSPYQRSLP